MISTITSVKIATNWSVFKSDYFINRGSPHIWLLDNQLTYLLYAHTYFILTPKYLYWYTPNLEKERMPKDVKSRLRHEDHITNFSDPPRVFLHEQCPTKIGGTVVVTKRPTLHEKITNLIRKKVTFQTLN